MFFRTIASLLKIGCIGFGGGSALIPIVEAEMVERKKLVTIERYTEHTIVANITPGALPVKLGALIGYDVCGIKGMVAGASAVALPGVMATVLLLALLSQLAEGAVHYIEMASVGISVFIIYILLEYIIKVQKNSAKLEFRMGGLVLMFLTFLFSCGKEFRILLRGLFGEHPLISGPPLLDISTIDILKLSFFVIFFTGGRVKSWRMIAAVFLSAVFLLLFGKNTPLRSDTAKIVIQIVMVVLSLLVIYDARAQGSRETRKPEIAKMLSKIGAFAVFMAASCAPALVMLGIAPEYIMDGALSTVTSFGGGEAYLSVADGMFVATGQIDPSVFYGQVVPVANALPGPILVKVLSGVGYMMGFGAAGIAAGFALALAGFGTAVSATCIVCVIVYTLYSTFSGLTVFDTLKRWILPVICGLLLTVIISMTGESLAIAAGTGLAGWIALIFMAALFIIVRILSHRFRLNDIILIIIAGLASVLVLGIL